jgi:outer membrane protein assembly factor BamB
MYDNYQVSGYVILVVKYDGTGEHQWTREFPGVKYDGANGATDLEITVDLAGNSYITGTTSTALGNFAHAFIAKYGPTVDNDETKNEPVWKHILRPEEGTNHGQSIALDGQGGVYIGGTTYGVLAGSINFGNEDAFVAKYSEEGGEPLWVTQFGGQYLDEATTIAANQDDCFVGGYWSGDLFIAKLNADDGALQWERQVEEAEQTNEYPKNIGITPNGNLIVGTDTRVDVFEDHTNRGEPDSEGVYPSEMLILAYDTDGERLWYELPGTPANDHIRAFSMDEAGYAYFSGSTVGNFGGHNDTEEYRTFTWKRFLGQ